MRPCACYNNHPCSHLSNMKAINHIMLFRLWQFILLNLLFSLSITQTTAWKAEWIRLDPSLPRITPRRSGLVPLTTTTTNHHRDDTKATPASPPMIFGGYAEDGDGSGTYNRYVTNDLWEWNDSEEFGSWRLVQTTGDIPAPRLVGGAAVLGNKAYLIGGWNSDAQKVDPQEEMFLDTVHELDLTSKTWTFWKSTRLPDGPASRHVALPLPDSNQILVHTHRCIDFVWLLDVEKQEFIRQPTTGSCPSPRGLHAACRIKNHHIVMFGGAAQDQTMSNQVFVLDTQTWEWTERIAANPAGPEPRASPCLCAVDDEHVIVFGGAQATGGGLKPHGDLWLFHLETSTWTLLQPTFQESDNAPPPRNAAAMFRIASTTTTSSSNSTPTCEFLLTGGWAPFVQTWDDCHILRLYKDDEDES